MAQRKRISRKDLREPDQFMVWFGRTFEWCRAYKRHLIVGGVAILVVGVGIAAWELYDARRRASAQTAYNHALDTYQSGQYAEALAAFQEVRDYGSTPHRDLAAIYVANSQLALGDTKGAIETLETLTDRISSGALTGQLASLTLALSYEMNNDCDAALRAVERVAGNTGPFQQEALLVKGRCSVRVGRFDNAIEVYRNYLEQFPGEDARQISIKLQELKARTAGS